MALLAFSSILLLFFERRVTVKIPGNLRTVLIAAMVLLVWMGNIFLGHQ
jgi:hypothetical protein